MNAANAEWLASTAPSLLHRKVASSPQVDLLAWIVNSKEWVFVFTFRRGPPEIDKPHTFPLRNQLKWRSCREVPRVSTSPEGLWTGLQTREGRGEDTQIPRDYRANGGGI
jgi:hypothetical protein